MKIYTFGDSTKPVMLLLPGTCCHYRTFEDVIPRLQDYFYVAAVSYDGFDETEDSIFPDMITETEKIEKYIKEHFGGRIFAAYGCSLGGSFIGLLIQRKNIHIEHGFLGSSDLDQSGRFSAKIKSAMVVLMFHKMLVKGKLPGMFKKLLEKSTPEEREYISGFMKFFGIGEDAVNMSFVKKASVRNQFYSDLVTPLEDGIDVPGTTLHVFYALKMGEEYEKRYLQHFKNPDIRRHNLQHEQLLVGYPDKWLEEILACCRMESVDFDGRK